MRTSEMDHRPTVEALAAAAHVNPNDITEAVITPTHTTLTLVYRDNTGRTHLDPGRGEPATVTIRIRHHTERT